MHKSSTLNIKLPYRAMIAFLLSLILIFVSLPIQVPATEIGEPETPLVSDSIPQKFLTLVTATIFYRK